MTYWTRFSSKALPHVLVLLAGFILLGLTPRMSLAQASAVEAATKVLEQIEQRGCPEGAGRLIFKRLPMIAIDLGAGPQFEVVIDYNAMVCSENSLAYRRFNGAPVLLFHAGEQFGFTSKWLRFVVVADQMYMEIAAPQVSCEEQELDACYRRIHVDDAGMLVIEYVPEAE
ncbi:hypothetical protein RAZWK3B_00255 [Roseobacter sp. AzwK-3b]|uniref:hypothetical protein n=1 Tax=Roseobacter sp. AzwK-3b TaxID=351016 RepID=UPI000156AA7C|nr:hypothetical protein [Roseobacter sp. AzwK-3b]EDM69934.1 hypothetical protein RAZWK3B_00255 [Roseobacter sp. AzwK-3b]